MALRWAAQLSGGALQWGAHFDAVGVPAAPSAVAGEPTGGTTGLITLTDNSAGTASHRVQIRQVGSPTWANAAGATNPMPPGVTALAATGLLPATQYEVQARAESSGGDSAYVAGTNWWTDNTGSGDSSIPPGGATAPAVSTQPAAQGVALGEAASFAVVATGTAPLAYQWRKNGVAISGATSASYTTPAVVAEDDGATYSVVISNVAGSVTSSAALLTVLTGWEQALGVYTLLAPVDQIDNLGGFAPKDPASRVTLAFDFKRFTATPQSASITVTRHRGAEDPTPDAIKVGLPAILGSKVLQRVQDGVGHCHYSLSCVATAPDGSRYVMVGVLPVVPARPL